MSTLQVAASTSERLAKRRFGYEERTALALLLPVLGVLMAVAVFPILYSLYLSFFDIKLTRPNRAPFIGLGNYIDLFEQPLFWKSVLRTVPFSAFSSRAVTLIALLVALLLNEKFRGRRILRTAILIPGSIPYCPRARMRYILASIPLPLAYLIFPPLRRNL